MRQLTSLDVQFLAAEDGRTHGHVSAVSILDPATAPEGKLTLPDITRVFRERLHLLPPLCWRLVEVPLGLDYPRWLDDPDFDLEFHLRELYLPPPGNLAQLAEQVSRIVSRPLDRARPLWECPLRPQRADQRELGQDTMRSTMPMHQRRRVCLATLRRSRGTSPRPTGAALPLDQRRVTPPGVTGVGVERSPSERRRQALPSALSGIPSTLRLMKTNQSVVAAQDPDPIAGPPYALAILPNVAGN
jgi:hypothetical protein